MNKYLVTIEFRYSEVINDEPSYKTKILTIGVYNSFENACLNGNNVLKLMENKFKLHEFPDGRKADKERLNKKNNLIIDLDYLKTPFQFFLKITELKYDEIETVIEYVLKSCERYKNFKNSDTD